MTPINLIHSMAKNISEVVKDYNFIAELQKKKPVSVYEQFLPVDKFEDDTIYPMVLVSCRRIEVTGKNFDFDRVCSLILTLGVYGGDKEDGWRDLFNMTERIMQFLFQTPSIDDKFSLIELPIFEPLADQPEPFLIGNILVKYIISTPRF